MVRNYRLIMWLLLTGTASVNAQDATATIHLTFEEVLSIAVDNSTAALQAQTLRETAEAKYQAYKAGLKPQVTVYGVLPDYNRRIGPVTQPDGSILFREFSYSNSVATLEVAKLIPATGGRLFVSSQLNRFDDYSAGQSRYNSAPFLLGFEQNIFSFNALRWQNRIEPLLYQESQMKYLEEIQAINLDASKLFFAAIIEQTNHQIALKNLENNEHLFKIGRERFALGEISKSELYQLNLSVVNAKKKAVQAKLELEKALLVLTSYLNIDIEKGYQLVFPTDMRDFAIDPETAVAQARKNKMNYVSVRRQNVEAAQGVASARASNRINLQLYGAIGLSDRAETVGEVYQDPNGNQTLRVGIRIPLVRWGAGSNQIKMAQSNKKYIEYSTQQNERNFERDIINHVRQFEAYREQLLLTAEADKLAQERYVISKERYVLGDLSFTDFGIAQQEKDVATLDYVLALRNYWWAYHYLRFITLYDFENQEALTVN